jgi:hypothetical protein
VLSIVVKWGVEPPGCSSPVHFDTDPVFRGILAHASPEYQLVSTCQFERLEEEACQHTWWCILLIAECAVDCAELIGERGFTLIAAPRFSSASLTQFAGVCSPTPLLYIN